MGWLKGNFNGPAKGNLGKAGCGGVLRDYAGNIIDVIAIPIGISNSHKVQVVITLYTMRIVVETGFQNFWLEGDSLNIVNMLNGKILVTWSIEDCVMEIKSLMNN